MLETLNKSNVKKILYISWTDFNWHAYLLANSIGAELIFIKRFRLNKILPKIVNVIIDYLYKSIKTIFLITKNKNDLFVFENPPPIGAVIGYFYKKIKMNFKYLIDAHNGAFEKPMISFPFIFKAFSNTEAVIVHNNPLREKLINKREFKDCKFFTLNDPIPNIPYYQYIGKTKDYLLVVTTFHGDEPIETVLGGIKVFLLNNPDSDLEFHVTGNYRKNLKVYEEYKIFDKIKFLGFVDQKEYHKELQHCLGVITYSVRDDVQQFATIEAIGAFKPFISNRNTTNLHLFDNKMILTNISPSEISEGIKKFLSEKENYKANIPLLRDNLTLKRKADLEKLISYLHI